MRRYGHIPDYPVATAEDGSKSQIHRPTDWTFAESKVAASRAVKTSDSIDLSHLLDNVQDQIGGTCVGQALGSSVYMRAQAMKRPIKRPSATLIVAIAQMIARPGKPVDCDGCQPSTAIRGTRDRGLAPLETWPETEENLVTIPTEDVFATAAGATLGSYYRIPDGGDVVEGLRQALAREYIPVFAMAVDQKFEDMGREVYDAPGGESLGNHAQAVVAYSKILDAFKVLGSWGKSFADAGFVWISAPFMARHTFDRLVVEQTPEEI